MLKIKKEHNAISIKFLGITLYKRQISEKESCIKTKLLQGLIYHKYDMKKSNFELRILGLKIFSNKLYNHFKVLYFLFIPVWFSNASNSYKKSFFNTIIKDNPNYSDYYIFPCRSGEFFLLMHHFQEWVEKNKSTKPLLVFTARYHLNICKMFYPNYDTCYVKKINVSLLSKGITSVCEKYQNRNFYIPVCEKYFVGVENAIRNNCAHYYDCLKTHLGLTETIHNYKISDKAEEKTYKIAKYILNEKFVIISPETLSNEPMEKDFWDDLCKELKNMGYEVFCNSIDFSNLVEDSTSTFLTYEESIALSKYAKAIIGMRSGFLECLSQSNVPLFALYTDFPKRQGFKKLSSDKVLSGFSIKKLPNVNPENIYEYDVNSFDSEENILKDIINKLKNE